MIRHLLTLAVAVALTGSALADKPAGEDGWTVLFDGKSLEGWKANENTDTWTVKDGALVCAGDRSHLFYVGHEAPFDDFIFQADVMTEPGSNAGIYFHTKYQDSGWPKFGYEVQVNNTHRDPKKTGSLYAVENVMKAPAKDNEWFTVWFKVEGKKVTIKVDGKTLVEYIEPEGKEAFSNQFERRLGAGTFALQGHDPKSVVHFKDIKVKKLD